MSDDLCVNVFSLLEQMVSTFNANLRLGGESFSHTEGFQPSNPDSL